MGGSSTPSHVTQTTTNQPPAYVQPYATQYLDTAGNLMMPGGNITPFNQPLQTLEGFNPMQQTALNQISAMGGQNPYITNTQNYLQNQMQQAASGQVPSSIVPWFQAAADPISGQMRGAALQSGAFGSSGAQAAESGALTDLAEKMFFPAWQQQQQLGMQAAGMQPGMMQASYLPSQELLQAGGLAQQQGQQQRNIDYQNQMAQANWPYELLNRFGQILGMSMGSGGVSTVQIPKGGAYG